MFIFTQNVTFNEKLSQLNQNDSVAFLQNALKIYSDIVMSRFVDYVSMQCHLFLVTNVYKQLHSYVDLENMANFIVDDRVIVNKRDEIKKSLFRFKNALQTLENLE